MKRKRLDANGSSPPKRRKVHVQKCALCYDPGTRAVTPCGRRLCSPCAKYIFDHDDVCPFCYRTIDCYYGDGDGETRILRIVPENRNQTYKKIRRILIACGFYLYSTTTKTGAVRLKGFRMMRKNRLNSSLVSDKSILKDAEILIKMNDIVVSDSDINAHTETNTTLRYCGSSRWLRATGGWFIKKVRISGDYIVFSDFGEDKYKHNRATNAYIHIICNRVNMISSETERALFICVKTDRIVLFMNQAREILKTLSSDIFRLYVIQRLHVEDYVTGENPINLCDVICSDFIKQDFFNMLIKSLFYA